MKRRLGLPKNVRDTIRLQNELKNWDQRLHALHLAIKYKEAKTEEEMESKIAQWRTYAQDAAMTLLPYYQEQAKNLSADSGYDGYGGYDNSSTYLNNDLTGAPSSEMENNNQEDGPDAKKDGESTVPDDMSTILNAIGIDPDVLHYSAELGDFY